MAKPRQHGREAELSKAPSEDEGFLGRWSRRKAGAKTAAVEQPPPTADLPEETVKQSVIDDEAENQQPAAPAFDPRTLPDIDKMGAGSDFRVFMQAGVPPALKTKALRKLWLVKPELANLDGLLDYGEDLTGSFKVVDHLKTAYQVGRGFLKDDQEEQAPKDAIADAGETVADGETAAPEDPLEPEEQDLSADDPEERDHTQHSEMPEESHDKG